MTNITAYKVHATSTVLQGLAGIKGSVSTCYYLNSEEEAIERCKKLLLRDPTTEFTIFKAIAVVRHSTPPIEVIHLED